MDKPLSDNFERAWTSYTSGCRALCQCDRVYFDTANDWDWETGEYEELLENSRSNPERYIACAGSIGHVIFEGVVYVQGCPCTKKVKPYEDFIRRNAIQIAEYLNANASDAKEHAERSSVVEIAP